MKLVIPVMVGSRSTGIFCFSVKRVIAVPFSAHQTMPDFSGVNLNEIGASVVQ